MKPIHLYENELSYQRHQSRLEEIKHRSSHGHSQEIKMRKIWFDNNRMMRHKSIKQQNRKLLDKLLNISERTLPKEPVHKKIKNDQTKKKMVTQAIQRQNELFCERLMNAKSDLEYGKLAKSIQQYQSLKKRMQKNKRAKLPRLQKF